MTAAPPILGVVGPTASGKTDLALALAERLPIEILVADSRQVYRGMDAGTAKPDPSAQRSVPHHLLDLAEPDEPFTVADWLRHARRAAVEVAGRDAVPLLVGGTGLYVSAFLDGHDYAAQAWSPEIRARLADELASRGLAPMAERLALVAPELAARIDVRNPRRVLRALERVEAGDGAVPRGTPYPGPVGLIALERPREALYRRIDERARRMFLDGGLLDEARRLLTAGYRSDLHPMTGHGYLEAMEHLAGTMILDEAISRTARRTRQYAKRQLTWFRRDPRVRWLPAGDRPGNDPGVLADAVDALTPALS